MTKQKVIRLMNQADDILDRDSRKRSRSVQKHRRSNLYVDNDEDCTYQGRSLHRDAKFKDTSTGRRSKSYTREQLNSKSRGRWNSNNRSRSKSVKKVQIMMTESQNDNYKLHEYRRPKYVQGEAYTPRGDDLTPKRISSKTREHWKVNN